MEFPLLPPNVHSVSCSLHPAFAMRGLRQYMASIITGMVRAKNWSERDWEPGIRAHNINPSPTLAEVQDHIARAGSGPFSVDIETPMHKETEILMVGISGLPGEAVVVPWQYPFTEVVKELMEDATKVKVGHNFAYDLNAFYANGIKPAGKLYDTIHMGALLWPPIQRKKKKGKRNMMSMKTLDLASCVLRVLDGRFYWKEPDKNATKALLSAAYPSVQSWLHPYLYCGIDCVETRYLFAVSGELLRREGMAELYFNVVAPAAQTLVRLEVRGLPVAREQRDQLRDLVAERIKAVEGEIQLEVATFHAARRTRVVDALTGLEERLRTALQAGSGAVCAKHPEYSGLTQRKKCPGCAEVFQKAATFRAAVTKLKGQIKAGEKVRERIGEKFSFKDEAWVSLLFSKAPLGLGLTPVSYTETKHTPQVDKKSLEVLFERNPTVGILRKRISLQSLHRRLRIGLAAPLDGSGRAHFTFSLHRSALGRLSSGKDDTDSDKVRRSSGGNGQNIRGEDRIVYCASGPDRRIVHIDSKQIEARNVAWHARELDLLRMWREGKDVYVRESAIVYGLPEDRVKIEKVLFKGHWVPARQAGKHIVLAWGYGMDVEESARQIGCSIHEATVLRNRYFSVRRATLQYHEDTINAAIKARYLRNGFGRKLKFYGFRKRHDGIIVLEERNEALAFIGQSETADICKAVLPKVERAAEACGGELLLTTHDSYDADIPLVHVNRYVALVKPILEAEWPQLGFIDGFGYFSCPVSVEVGRNMGDQHICAKQEEKCDEPCLLVNPDGLEAYNEQDYPAA